MAISVDTVYQRVLAITNKEQRGYLTPEEFNLLANQAQLDIFEQYFYDLNQFNRVPGNSKAFSDMVTNLEEKISLFEKAAPLVYVVPYWEIPTDLYRLGTITYDNKTNKLSLYPTPNTPVETTTVTEVERANFNELLYLNQSKLTKPTNSRPVYVANENGYKIYGNEPIVNGVMCNYIKIPAKVEWVYRIVYGESLYDSTTSVNFELHQSDETELVVKILELSGLILADTNVYQAAAQMEAGTVQQEKL